MIRLNIVVEGATEETFVRDVLAPYWGAKGIFATARSVETNRKKGDLYLTYSCMSLKLCYLLTLTK